MAGVCGGCWVSEFLELDRAEFRALKRQFVHPAKEVSHPTQLVGRDRELRLVEHGFERDGAHIFIWGRRGVGKTSLAHSAIAEHNDLVVSGPAIGCEPASTVKQILGDIIRRAVRKDSGLLQKDGLRLKLGAFGQSLEKGWTGGHHEVPIETVNQASDVLHEIFVSDYETHRSTAVIIDEFDQLGRQDTVAFLTALAKQMSVDDVKVKLIFCGVASDLEALIGSHESVGRYIAAVKLEVLPDDKIWDIVRNIFCEFHLEVPRGQLVRIGQVACGYPTFAHLISDEILNVAFEQGFGERAVSQEIFDEAMRRSAASAATHLQGAYERATMKGTDRYVEVLWAVSNGPHIQERQYKDVREDYLRIMGDRSDRDTIEKDATFRNHVNALCADSHGSVLIRPRAGWYRFKDPMFRGYVRMLAYNAGVELGDESFAR